MRVIREQPTDIRFERQTGRIACSVFPVSQRDPEAESSKGFTAYQLVGEVIAHQGYDG